MGIISYCVSVMRKVSAYQSSVFRGVSVITVFENSISNCVFCEVSLFLG